jgi:hypothetical protein
MKMTNDPKTEIPDWRQVLREVGQNAQFKPQPRLEVNGLLCGITSAAVAFGHITPWFLTLAGLFYLISMGSRR